MTLLAHEEVVVRRGERSGLYLVVAVHSTALGPALGGARLWPYQALGDAIVDALRLSEAMTYKAAAAGLDLGGGKAVLCAPPEGELPADRRRELMLDLGDVVESLEGRYVTAEDVGTGTADMTVISERTSHVVGRPVESGGSGDPSPVTARGVEAAMRACCEHRYGSPDLADRRIAIVGLGHVGLALAERLTAARAKPIVSDIDSGKHALADQLKVGWVDPAEAMAAECDVLAPCALGGAIDPGAIGELRCEIVCGSANNVLASDSLADVLADREILYAPDFIANAGGLINVYGELHDLGRERLDQLVDGIGDAIGRVFEAAEARSITPLEVARAVALERLQAAAPHQDTARGRDLVSAPPVDRVQLSDWIERYERAWRSPGTDALAGLFTEDATYSTAPYENPHRGLPAIGKMWEAERLGPDEEFEMTCEVVAIDGDTGVARVTIHYGPPREKEYRDLWIVRLGEDGLCSHFEEWPFWPPDQEGAPAPGA